MLIHVKNLKDRKIIDVQVGPTSTTDDVKVAVEQQAGVALSAQRLVFAGKPLRDGVSLSEVGVQKGSMLHLVLRLKTYIELNVRVMSGRTIDIDQDPKAPVGYAHGQIDELLGLDDRPRVLCFEGKRLDETMTLAEAGLKDGSLLHLILVPLPNLGSRYKDEADRTRIYGMAG